MSTPPTPEGLHLKRLTLDDDGRARLAGRLKAADEARTAERREERRRQDERRRALIRGAEAVAFRWATEVASRDELARIGLHWGRLSHPLSHGLADFLVREPARTIGTHLIRSISDRELTEEQALGFWSGLVGDADAARRACDDFSFIAAFCNVAAQLWDQDAPLLGGRPEHAPPWRDPAR
ncbi:hypothetical protein [Tautonia plasticadhaerens]|uniref:Uncharacterized protein n=1 Tax=Tautonia plasticadhaerens TaxID=2527974 RepID=A0A518HF56_9BACT|nr:hypothetical protein [Tautonia plasticadhaerens]QDV39396.1 hypothetical protein ElP_73630 [Tautonia plasticadhaerens]QDV39485.1 hypothetical protein ElP_74520 [Tautonia plasticadhaerens]